MSNGRFVFCQYSDDLRHEVGGKVSVIGLYQGGMHIAGSAPVALPRLVISAFIHTPFEQPFRAVSMQVFWRDTILQHLEPTTEVLHALQQQPGDPDAVQGRLLNFVVQLQPLHLDGDGKLGVRVTVDGEVIEGNALLVRFVTPLAESPPIH